MRARSTLMFAAGFAAGCLLLTVLLLQSGSLRIGSAGPPATTAPAPAAPDHAPAPAAAGPAEPSREADRIAEPPPPLEPEPDMAAALPPQLAPGTDDLAKRRLIIPVKGAGAEQLVDTFDAARSAGTHDAIDIMAPAGTPVIAAGDGRVAKLFTSERGGLTVYQFDGPELYAYYYAHLSGYAPGLKEGVRLRKGDLVGYVGSTGDASPEAPHLHFAIFKLGPEKQWWKGTPVNPFPFLTVPAR